MSRRASIYLGIAVLVILNISCAKLTEEKPVTMGAVAVEELPFEDSFPSNWGKLITVSSAPDIRHWVQLWFEDDEGNIRMATYNIIQNELSDQVRVFHRK
ncbi:MAG: hypothetical protein GTO51_08765 [Candidatus Latescibacteria bacterium]|nr:hypothetical protein [Candidatus Latescibacterota bacterium]NIM22044.1 hypothetical protein [Candidatus Latescibacterota bacterium]NIM66062.1 hypothetical protein [Candidatus Latescibacterota bacterium]NIO02470.1 hypothetical protein [Candidatus Latescibacterota bacterium]NIO29381.1 hypothetical protein [Candidatus Latescibacterota bacterium]